MKTLLASRVSQKTAPEAEERSLPLNDVTQRELISAGSADSLYR